MKNKKIAKIVTKIKKQFAISGKPTAKDFKRICKAENIVQAKLKLEKPGYYVAHENDHYFFIKKGLTKSEQLELTAFYIGCYFLHSDDVKNGVFRRDEVKRRAAKIEADIFTELLLGGSILDAEVIQEN